MFRKPVFWIVLVLLLGLGGGGYYYYTTVLAKPVVTAAAVQTLQTSTVKQGNIVISAAGTGTLVPASTVDLAFPKSGVLTEVNVRVGDQVKVGQILAKQGNLDSLQMQIANDQLSILNAQQTLDDLYKNLEAERASAAAALVTAQKNLTNATYSRDVYQTQRCDPAVVTLYYGDLVNAQTAYDKVNNDFLTYFTQYPENDPRRINAYAKLYASNQTLQSALRNYNYCTGRTDTATTVDLTAQAASAQAAYNIAKANVDLLKDGPDPVKLAQAQAKLDLAKMQLKVDQQSLTDTTMICPTNGVVTVVKAQVGATFSGTLFTIADNLHPMIQTYMDQSDLNNFGMNYAVNVTFDAISDKTFTGKVTQIEPALVTQGGVAYVRGLVALDESAVPVVSKLPSGMSAAVQVISGQANNTLLIPIEALRELSTGNYAVFVVQPDQKLILTPIKTGLRDLTTVQVLSGLKVGDVVSLGSTTTKTTTGTTK